MAPSVGTEMKHLVAYLHSIAAFVELQVKLHLPSPRRENIYLLCNHLLYNHLQVPPPSLCVCNVEKHSQLSAVVGMAP